MYGIPESSSRPWIAPSSPSLPCRTGNTTSRRTVSHRPVVQDEQPGCASVRRQHGRPAVAVLPVRAGAVAELPGAVARDADPERLVLLEVEALRDLLGRLDGDGVLLGAPPEHDSDLQPRHAVSSFEAQAVDEGVLDHVGDGVVGVVGRVRGDEHVRHRLEPQEQVALDGPVPEVGVEDPFLALEDVQRRTAQAAALQCRRESLGVDECTAPGVDDDGAGLQPLDASAVEEMAGVGGERGVQRHDVALLQQLVERDVPRRRPGDGCRGSAPGSRNRAAGPRRRSRCDRFRRLRP